MPQKYGYLINLILDTYIFEAIIFVYIYYTFCISTPPKTMLIRFIYLLSKIYIKTL